jgi:hypothetical protein
MASDFIETHKLLLFLSLLRNSKSVCLLFLVSIRTFPFYKQSYNVFPSHSDSTVLDIIKEILYSANNCHPSISRMLAIFCRQSINAEVGPNIRHVFAEQIVVE